MDYSVIYIATTAQQAHRIQDTLKRMKLDFPVFEAYGNNALSIARNMIENNNTHVIVSRGGTMKMLSNHVNVPVIDIRHSIIDIWLSMEKALKMSDKIAVVGYQPLCSVATRYKQIMNYPLEIVTISSDSEFSEAIIKLKAQGIKLIIGGIPANAAALEHGLLFVSSDADENSIEQATYEAINMLRLENERIERFKTLETIINHTIEGIIYIDNKGTIIHINNNAKRILNYHEGMCLSELIPDQYISGSMSNGTINVNQLIELNGTSIILNCIPIIVKGKLISMIVTVQKEDDIISLDHKIRRKNASRGYIAKRVFSDIVSNSPVMESLKERAKKYALSDSTIAIYGETGTGKEMLVQSIHNYSHRSRNPFVAINCAALPETILESELFGYASGAFTGALREGRAGIFELANHGTVFLDEINELSMRVQAKFLRVIQEKEISRIGDDRVIPVDIRIIVASNKRLYNAVETGAFRSDLYYRLCVLELEIPPLRQRKEDIPALVYSFIKEWGFSNTISFDKEALDLLCAQNWEGNVRQLSNVIERILSVDHTTRITSKQVEDAFGYLPKKSNMYETSSINADISNMIDEAQIKLIRIALEKSNGNRTKTAEILSISTATLWRKMKKYNML